MSIRIYTKTGDEGDTGLFGGRRVSKDDIRVEAYGAVDELNASIGAVRAHQSFENIADLDDVLDKVQHDLFAIGADLATPFDRSTTRASVAARVVRIDSSRTLRLEGCIDGFESELEPLRQFVLPGGHPVAALLHVSRTICRRAERRCVTLGNSADNVAPGLAAMEPEIQVNPEVIKYLNRLSDLLFVMARTANKRADLPDVKWRPEA